MKRLTLLRHAKSGWDDPVARDFDRPLNARGRKGAWIMGDYAKRHAIPFDKIISSPAIRCVETMECFAEGFGETLAPAWDKRIYLASAVTLMEVVQETPDSIETLIMCGHNPGMEDLVLMAVPDSRDDPLRDLVEEKYPTAAIATLEFPVDRWEDIAARTARFASFVRPRDLDPALGPEHSH